MNDPGGFHARLLAAASSYAKACQVANAIQGACDDCEDDDFCPGHAHYGETRKRMRLALLDASREWSNSATAAELSHATAAVLSRATVLAQVFEELARGLDKWGGASSDDRLDRLTWLRLIDEHRIRGTRHGANADEYRHELVVIAALAIAGIEAHDRRSAPATAESENT